MPSSCTICIASNRATFEANVAGGMTVKSAARRARLPYDAALRHMRLHGRYGDAGKGTRSTLETFEKASGHAPMTWQRTMLAETRDTLLVKGRQVGATEVASALAVHVAMHKPGSTSAIISPSQRQSSEVTVRARLGFWALGETLRQDSVSLLRLANGSRVISLPGSARGIRGYAADLAVLDEAAWLSAETFAAARPLTVATGGRLIIQSTPGAPVGPFYDLVTEPPDDWAFMKVRSDEVATISAAKLERERREMAEELYRQEYEAEFASALSDRLFTAAMVDAMFEPEKSA